MDPLMFHLRVMKSFFFITFIDEFSHYCYLYLLREKSQSMDVQKVFINEVEMQLDIKVEVVRSNRDVHLQSSLKVEAHVHNILCLAHHSRMVWLKDKIVL
ncbi:hypothetical protein CR513_40824, partial [Mucuna pruriens]